MSDYKPTLVFDLDGTLTDPTVGFTRCLKYALSEHGYPTIKASDVTSAIGPPLEETLLRIAPAGAADHVDSLVAKYREQYSAVGFSENEVYPEIPDALCVLAESGFRLGVCTSKLAMFAEQILSMFGLRDHFSFIDGGDIGISKRQQLRGLLDRGVIDSSAIMIGDRSIDIDAARVNGLRSIAVLWGFGGHDEIARAQPTHIAGSVGDLLAIIADLRRPAR